MTYSCTTSENVDCEKEISSSNQSCFEIIGSFAYYSCTTGGTHQMWFELEEKNVKKHKMLIMHAKKQYVSYFILFSLAQKRFI